jgi:hypothetical protein
VLRPGRFQAKVPVRVKNAARQNQTPGFDVIKAGVLKNPMRSY